LFVSNRDIRREAAVSCTKLIVREGEAAPTRGHSAVVVGEVLEKLLVVGIADPGFFLFNLLDLIFKKNLFVC
jgi:hypothetical protein